jgi:hypothetical protein
MYGEPHQGVSERRGIILGLAVLKNTLRYRVPRAILTSNRATQG